MTPEFLAVLVAGAAAGGFVNGLAGFGTALMALGFWLQIMAPGQAVALVAAVAVTSGAQGVWLVRAQMLDNRRRLARFLGPALLGVPLGAASLSWLDAASLKLTIAGLLILYGGFFSLRRALPTFDRPTPVADMLVGVLGGVLGGAASLSGALPTMWCAMRPWPKSETRAVLQPYNVAVLGLSALLFAFKGAYGGDALILLAIALPVSMVAARLGILSFGRLSDDRFRRIVIGLMFASGLVLLIREAI